MSHWQDTKDHVNAILLATVFKNRPLVDPVSAIYNNNLPGAMDKVLRHAMVYGVPECVAPSIEYVRDAAKLLDKQGWLK
ncbi:hypothetical protein phiAS5_ORF0203 [Aeromonas phage phiAS5]|uniref:Uncharacterized protein n=1 Tax=Aeromonas phage phiAS5 TaxID=879630 RepID=E1A2V0_9CAUD|nr:hypothetical protein phiAS5_ORF0203 [Aeromonas phage phiAS5]ADM80046.1 hypothetical protein phiAS5_ORF0203 [Aeromonas phage phiAS5]